MRFQEIATRRTIRWTDADGKRHQETRKFWQTLNPFNVGKDGAPKSAEAIYAEIKAEADAFVKRGQPNAVKS